MTIKIGWDPPPLVVPVAAGGTYHAEITSTVNWPAGDAIDLLFTGAGSSTTWTASITGGTASWTKTVAQVAALLATDARAVALRYTPSGGEPMIWYRGTVQVV